MVLLLIRFFSSFTIFHRHFSHLSILNHKHSYLHVSHMWNDTIHRTHTHIYILYKMYSLVGAHNLSNMAKINKY